MSGSANKHARFSPSGSKRWLNCTASITKVDALKEEGKIPLQSPSSPAAREGTGKHDLAEEWLRHLLLDDDKPEQEYCEQLAIYIDTCVEQAEGANVFEIEAKVPLFYTPDEYGTADFFSFNKEKNTIYITDLKWGMHEVEAEGNTQLAIYANSAINEILEEGEDYDSGTAVEMTIVQPRIAGDKVKTWRISVAELGFFCMPISDTVEKIIAETGLVFAPSRDNCFFCEAKAFCSANIGPVKKVKDSVPLTAESAKDIDPDLIDYIFQHGDKIVDVVEMVKEEYQRRAEEGNMPPNSKFVRGRMGNRAWTDTVVVKNFCIENGIDPFDDPPVKSPTKLLKENPLHKDELNELIVRKEGKLSLVPESAKGDPVSPDTMNFDLD